MASTQPVDDSFLDEVDDSFLDEVDESPYGLAWQKTGAPDEAPTEPTDSEVTDYLFARQDNTKRKLVADMEAKYPQLLGIADERNEDVKDTLKAVPYAFAQGATLGNAKRIGKLASPEGTPVDSDYDEAKRKAPVTSAVTQGLASTPAMMAINPLGRIAGWLGANLNGSVPTLAALAKIGVTGPGAAKILAMLGAGGDAALTTGAQAFSESDAQNFEGKAYDALAGASLAAPMGMAAVAGPEAIMSAGRIAKSAVGKSLQMPKKGADALADWLGGAPKQAPAPAEDDFLSQLAAASSEKPPDNVVPIRPDQADVDTKLTPLRNLMRDQDGSMYMGGKGPKFKSKKDAFKKIAEASGVDDFSKQSVEAGHFDEINRIVGRKVKGTEDAFAALVSASAKKRGKAGGTHEWEDVQTAIRELKKLDGLEDLQLPADVQESILPVEPEPSFNFGFNEKAKEGFNVGKMKRGEMEDIAHEARDRASRMAQEAKNAARAKSGKDPEFLRKSQELADLLAQDADTAITPVDMRPNSIHENATPNQIQDGARYADAQGLDPNVPLSAQGGPHIKHKGAFRDKGYSFPKDKAGWENEPHWWKAGPDDSEPSGGIMDLMMQESESPQQAAAWEALNRNERNASKWRNPSDVDSRVFRQPQAQPAMSSAMDKPTNAKGGASLYQPNGISAVDDVGPPRMSVDEILEQVKQRSEAAGKGNWADAFGTPSAKGAAEDALFLERGIPGAPDEVLASNDSFSALFNGKQGTKKIGPGSDTFAPRASEQTRVGGPALRKAEDAGAAQQAISPADTAAIAEARQRGYDKMGKVAGIVGGVSGGYHGGLPGAYAGYKGGQMGMKGAAKAFDKAADIGKRIAPEQMASRMAKDPAMLHQIANSGGPMAGAARFILQGADEAGDIGLKARAFVAASMPALRELFATGSD